MGNMIRTTCGFGLHIRCTLDFGHVEDGDAVNMMISWIGDLVEKMVNVKQKTLRK